MALQKHLVLEPHDPYHCRAYLGELERQTEPYSIMRHNFKMIEPELWTGEAPFANTPGRGQRREKVRIVQPTPGDAVLVSFLGDFNRPEIASFAGENSLTAEPSGDALRQS